MPHPEVEALAVQRQLIDALRDVVEGLQSYRITRVTAAGKLHAALSLRHRDHQSESSPSLEVASGYSYGAVRERIAFDFADCASLRSQIPRLSEIADDLKAGLSDFHRTHRIYPPTKKHHDR